MRGWAEFFLRMLGFGVGSFSEIFKEVDLIDTGGVLRGDILIHQSCTHGPPQRKGDTVSAPMDRWLWGERKRQVVLEERIIESPAPVLYTFMTWKFFLRSDLTPSCCSRFFLPALILASLARENNLPAFSQPLGWQLKLTKLL